MGQIQSVVDSRKKNSNFLKMDDTIFIYDGTISNSFGDNSPIQVIKNRLSGDMYIKKSIIQGLMENCLQGIIELKDTPDQ